MKHLDCNKMKLDHILDIIEDHIKSFTRLLISYEDSKWSSYDYWYGVNDIVVEGFDVTGWDRNDLYKLLKKKTLNKIFFFEKD